ncbi:MAG TPA: diphthine--ammonia ligase [Pyrinomonadaceae bacterium]|nr:diphthine--ammonia ligase [Pyrinomonadaceae bacterium]
MATGDHLRDADKTAVLMSWSGGKDSCFALYETQRGRDYRVVALLTTLTRDYDRISMHGVRRELLEQQADSLGLPLQEVFISKDAGNEEYEQRMAEAFSAYREKGIDSVVFGDLFLEDIRAYREQFLARKQMAGIFPVWRRDTSSFIRDFIKLGFKAVVTCVDAKVLDQSFAGRQIDEEFLSDLPGHVDPCGENGEFHSFVFDGPNFAEPVKFSLGEVVLRESFWFCDLIPARRLGQPGFQS